MKSSTATQALADTPYAPTAKDLAPSSGSGALADLSSIGEFTDQYSLGVQTAEAAHDFNNILAVVMACAAELESAAEADSTVQLRAAEIREAAESGARLTKDMIDAARPGLESLATTDVNAAVFDSVSMVRRLTGERISVRCELGAGLPRVGIGRERIEQCLLNLAGNARDAILGEGTLTLRTLRTTVGSGDPDLAPGSYICVSVSDDGGGMSPELLDRVTEPSFTTKATGSGLGLPTVLRVAREVGGDLRIRSAQGVGTTVSVLLPAIVAARGNPAAPAVRFGS